MIKKIRILNFKQFENISIQFSNVNILVGNNNCGKSTILEAISLALTGYYKGKSINKCLSQNIFNKKSVDAFLSNETHNFDDLPTILIELEIDESNAKFIGNNNLDRSRKCGFQFHIKPNEKYRESFANQNDKIYKTLPIEYYDISWSFFNTMNEVPTCKEIPFKSFTIDSDNFQSNTFYTSRIIKAFIDETDSFKLSQEERESFQKLLGSETIKNVNIKIEKDKELKQRCVKLGLTELSKNSWETIIGTSINDLPFEYSGKGEQCIVKTCLSLSTKNEDNKRILLIEEPESHLSHTNLNKLMNIILNSETENQIIITTHNSFVANKIGLNNLILLNDKQSLKLRDLEKTTYNYFKKLSGFDTLRFVLSEKNILVEGDSDELIVQRAYLDKFGKLPIEDGVDVISVNGLSYKRFLEIAKQLNIKTHVATDNDGNIERLQKIEDEYKKYKNIQICYNQSINHPFDLNCDPSTTKIKNFNTLEIELFKSNSLKTLNKIFEKQFENNEECLIFMLNNKTDCALSIFESSSSINYPEYIRKAIDFND